VNHTHDIESDAWYFTDKRNAFDKRSHTMEYLGRRDVIVDFDENGNVIGVEVL
jgi:uncharacterized protein YuzE